jgi:dihydrofolate synthase/folylpolyglutamate synthase
VDYEQALAYLLSFSDLERGVQKSANPTMSVGSVRSLLARLGDPHLGRHTVHVTGSKGKGSTAAMITGILGEEGRTTALFTSPHLHSFTERIALNGQAVSREEFAAGLDAIRPAIEAEAQAAQGAVSTFGCLVALFSWLVRAQARPIDWQVVEVGLGGSFDATNVFAAPDVVVITPISLEHTAILGSTTVEIAADKAGLVKPGCICVLARQKDPAVVDVVRARCQETGARLVEVGAAYESRVLEKHPYGQSFEVSGPGGTRELRTPMLGEHQVDNAVTALAVAEALRERGEPISEAAIANGLAHTRVPGRLEVMGQRPLVVADGAHNPESAAALAAALRGYFEWNRAFVVLGVTEDKDIRGIGLRLAGLADLIVCCRFGNQRSLDPYVMIQEIGFLGPPAMAEETVVAGIDTALSHASPEDLVCITGSLYVVAEAREYILGEAISAP